MATIGLLLLALGSALVWIGLHGGPTATINPPNLTGVQGAGTVPPPNVQGAGTVPPPNVQGIG